MRKMNIIQSIFVLTALLQKETSAHQEEANDHLTCFKVRKDDKETNIPGRKMKVTMTANKVQPEYTVEKCRVVKLTRFCVPSSKKVNKGNHDASLGGLIENYDPNRCIQNDFLCYKINCVNVNLPDQSVVDQFNIFPLQKNPRTILFKKGYEMCTPAWKVDTNGEIILNDECPSDASPTMMPSCSETNEPTLNKTNDPTPSPSKSPIETCSQKIDDECSFKRGKCTKNCVPSQFSACEDICVNIDPDDPCLCKIPRENCTNTSPCKRMDGRCVKDCKPNDYVVCNKELCIKEEGCFCKYKQTPPKCINKEGDECSKLNGTCMKNCQPSEFLDCKDGVCPIVDIRNPCRCAIRKSSSCTDTTPCKKMEGRCVKECKSSDNVVCDKDFCIEEEGCFCKYDLIQLKCPQKLDDECSIEKGNCIKDCKENQFFTCKDICKHNSPNDPCLCEIPKEGCSQTDPCDNMEGSCVKDCVPFDDTVCNKVLCIKEEGCVCKYTQSPPKCINEVNDKCSGENGICMKNCQPNAFLDCKENLCQVVDDNNPCLCAIRKPICTNTTPCKRKSGRCVKDCEPSDTVTCNKELCIEEEGCYCKYETIPPKCINVEGDECSFMNGTCMKNCRPSAFLDCKVDVCPIVVDGTDPCLCAVRTMPLCSQTGPCEVMEGNCVKDCQPSDTVTCNKELCIEEEGCYCKYKSTPPKCVNEVNDKCSNLKGTCMKNCQPSAFIDCVDNICKSDSATNPCRCAIRKPPCSITDQCNKKPGGQCVKQCISSKFIGCDKELCTKDSGCICRYSTITPSCFNSIDDQCNKLKGTCMKNCQPSQFLDCKENLCLTDSVSPCLCAISKVVECGQRKSCNSLPNGKCVKECKTSKGIGCDRNKCNAEDGCICRYNTVVAPTFSPNR